MVDWDAELLAPLMAVFGDAVTYRPRGAGAAPFTVSDAVFDEAYTYVVRDRDGGEVTTTSPMVGVRAAVCPMAHQDDLVDIGVYNGRQVNSTYLVKDVRPDNHGHLVLLLSLVGPLS